MKQSTLFGEEILSSKKEQKYSTKVEAPIYVPKNKKPHILELYDFSKTNRLIQEIKNSNVTEEEKRFLTEAAKRHTVFNYEKIADYYANSNSDVQTLMERSALVIIDFEKAIELGYVNLCDEIHKQYLEEYE
jgi:hypothetical protein